LLLRALLAQYKIGLATFAQYRVGLLIWALARFTEPIIYLTVWTTVQTQTNLDFDRGQIVAYFIGIMMVNQFTFAKILWRYEDRIRHGNLSFMLLRPTPIVFRDAADNLASKTLQAPFVITGVIIMALVFRPTFSDDPAVMVLFPLAVMSAWLLNFVVDYMVGMSAFWVVRTNAIDALFYLVLFFFSGRVAPPDLLPPVFQAISWVLPFRWILAFPTELLVGQLNASEIVVGFMMQAIWFLIALVALNVFWRAGVRRYGAVGG
jgi:ABC-2 type transport system permease protein